MSISKKINSLMIFCTIGIFFVTPGFADTVTGELVFVKKPAFTGLLYFEETNTAKNSATIDQKNKEFTHKLVVGSSDSNITFINSDTIDHNIYANDIKKKVSFDIGVMKPGGSEQILINWPENTLVRISCKIHTLMRTYIANISSNYYQVLPFKKPEKSYAIKIDNVPANLSKLNLLMPKYKLLTIELKKGESKTIEVKKKNKLKATLNLKRQ